MIRSSERPSASAWSKPKIALAPRFQKRIRPPASAYTIASADSRASVQKKSSSGLSRSNADLAHDLRKIRSAERVCLPRAPGREVGIVEVRQGRERAAVDQADPRLLDIDQTVLAQAAQHAVDVRRAQAEHVGDLLLRERHVERRSVADADRAQPKRHLQDEVRNTLAGAAATYGREALSEHRGFAGARPEQCHRE